MARELVRSSVLVWVSRSLAWEVRIRGRLYVGVLLGIITMRSRGVCGEDKKFARLFSLGGSPNLLVWMLVKILWFLTLLITLVFVGYGAWSARHSSTYSVWLPSIIWHSGLLRKCALWFGHRLAAHSFHDRYITTPTSQIQTTRSSINSPTVYSPSSQVHSSRNPQWIWHHLEKKYHESTIKRRHLEDDSFSSMDSIPSRNLPALPWYGIDIFQKFLPEFHRSQRHVSKYV